MVRMLLCLLLVFNVPYAGANELARADNALMRGDYSGAVEILKSLSNDGNATAMTHLASLYHRGEGVQRDVGKAAELYLAAAELGNPEAQFNLGNMYLLGEGLPQDESWALSFYRLAAEQGHRLAAQNMRELDRAKGADRAAADATPIVPGQVAPAASPVRSTSTVAAEPAIASADPGSAAPYEGPLAAPVRAPATKNPAVTRSVAAPRGAPSAAGEPDPPAAVVVAEIQQRAATGAGQSAPISNASAATDDAPIVALEPIESPVETAAQPLTSDQTEALRLAKAHGIAVDIDPVEAGTAYAPARAAAFDASTVAGHAARYERAERMLALENYPPAISELTDLAAAGHAGSAWRLAALHAGGQNVPEDRDAALRWQERAAKLGHVDAQFALGEKYAGGRGVAPDEAMAITYYRDAARGGHVQAREKLRAIYAAAGLPMPELMRPRVPQAITAPGPERPAQRVEPAPLASLPAIPNRESVENAGASPPQTQTAATDIEPIAPAAIGGGESAPRVEQRDEPADVAIATAASPVRNDVANVRSNTPRDDAPGTTDPAAAIAAAQPRLAPDAIVIHPERITVPAVADTGIAPASPANHEVVPGSLLAVTGAAAAGQAAASRSTSPASDPGMAERATAVSALAVMPREPASANDADEKLALSVVDPDVSAGDDAVAANAPVITAFDAVDAGSGAKVASGAQSVSPVTGAAATGTAATATVADGKRALASGDLTTAAQIFTRLAEAGDAEAQAHIGYMYYKGEGVGMDLERAVDWYRLAAVQGNRDAQYNLAVAYAFGEGIRQDDGEAVTWYRRAAEQGSAIAQYSLGMSYALGEGVPQDDAEAINWYRAAAVQGYAAAQYNLGYSYRTGNGVVANESEAIRWFEAAAANGHASAQYSLGYMYRSGRGVERDVGEAIKWYRLAAAQGHPDARADLASLNPGG